MKVLDRDFERLKKRAGKVQAGDLRYVYNLVAEPMLGLMGILANAASVEEMRAHAQEIPFTTNLDEMTDAELWKFHEQLQILWDWPPVQQSHADEKKFCAILNEWLTRFELSEEKRWTVWLKEGFFFPTPMNFTAVMARILYDNRYNLKRCVNCGRRFVGRKYSSKYCAQPDCRRFYNNERQNESKLRRQAAKGTKAKTRRTA